MDIKEGVDWSGMHSSMWYARAVTDNVYWDLFNRTPVITSARRPTSPGGSSLHPKGKALDLRTRDLKQAETRALAKILQERLGPDFFVLIEGPHATNDKYRDRDPHIHVQYNGR